MDFEITKNLAQETDDSRRVTRNEDQLDSDKNAVKSDASWNSERKTGRPPRIIRIELSSISDTHKVIQSIKSDLNIQPMRLPSISMTQDRSFVKTFELCPIIVIKVGLKLQCIGNFRLLWAAKAVLNLNEKLWCIEVFDLNDEQIEQQFISEFIYFPVVFGVHFSERLMITSVAQKALQLGKWEPPAEYRKHINTVVKYMSKIYGVDERTLSSSTVESIVNPIETVDIAAENNSQASESTSGEAKAK